MLPTNYSRRGFLRYSAAGVFASTIPGWLEVLSARAAEGDHKHKSCILLYMAGGPAHQDTFDLKPDAPIEYGGPFKPINTSVEGIQISEHFPKFARLMEHAAIIRSMSTSEGEHSRAAYHTRTGYPVGAGGGLSYPALGSIVSAELGRKDSPIPSFVQIGPIGGGSSGYDIDSGFLGPLHQPILVKDPGAGVGNLKPWNGFESRLGLLEEMQEGFLKTYKAPVVQAQDTALRRSVQLMSAKENKAFDISQEPASAREAYGKTKLGDACLLARRLVEVGVPFIHVDHFFWDTHGFGGSNCFEATKNLSLPFDIALAALINDLKDRGLLDSTLIVCMGEFGRTPKIGGTRETKVAGRGHYPNAWSTVLVGGGIKGGQVIGKTDEKAATVVERPVSIYDFMATICKVLGIDYTKENRTPIGRPIRIVDKHPKPIQELWA